MITARTTASVNTATYTNQRGQPAAGRYHKSKHTAIAAAAAAAAIAAAATASNTHTHIDEHKQK